MELVNALSESELQEAHDLKPEIKADLLALESMKEVCRLHSID